MTTHALNPSLQAFLSNSFATPENLEAYWRIALPVYQRSYRLVRTTPQPGPHGNLISGYREWLPEIKAYHAGMRLMAGMLGLFTPDKPAQLLPAPPAWTLLYMLCRHCEEQPTPESRARLAGACEVALALGALESCDWQHMMGGV